MIAARMIENYWLIFQAQNKFFIQQFGRIWTNRDCNLVWKTSKGLMIELTCRNEENIKAAQLRKQTCHLQPKDQTTSTINWNWSSFIVSPSALFTPEIGALCFVTHLVEQTLHRLGISMHILSKVCKNIPIITARCFFAKYKFSNPIT